MRTPNPLPPSTGVAITAVGAVTASGTSVAELFEDLLSGRQPFTTKQIPLVVNALPAAPDRQGTEATDREAFAAHVDASLDLTEVVGARAARAFSRDSRLLAYAMHSTGADLSPYADRTGVVLGTLRAGRNEYLAIHNASRDASAHVNPVWGPQSGYNAPAAQLSIHLPARGPNLTLSSGATAGLDAVVVGAQQVIVGTCDVVVAAGLDTLSAAVAGAAGRSGGVHVAEGEGPGEVPEGEAAAVVVLQDAQHVGQALAHVLGAGQATAPFADGADEEQAQALAEAAEDAIRGALQQAGRLPTEVGMVVTASGGNRAAGAAESVALASVFDTKLPVCDATRTTGRTGGADGTLAVAVAVEALARGVVPAFAGPVRTPQSAPVRDEPVPPVGPLAVCLSVEPGGNVTAVLLSGADRNREGVS